MIRLLTFTNLYPDPVRPRHGIFVEHRLRKLVATGKVEAQVVCPVPWCPFPVNKKYPQYRVRDIPMRDVRDGIVVHRPRYWVVPGVTSAINPWSMARVGISMIKNIVREGYDFDVIDAQYVYPDSIAAALISEKLGKPVTFTARGSDVNVALLQGIPTRWFRHVQHRVAAFIGVSEALKNGLIDAGADPLRVHVIRNGVDLELFSERDRLRVKQRLQINKKTILSVGNLINEKGHHLVIKAMTQLPQVELVIIGSGTQLQFLQSLAIQLNVADRIRWVSHVNQSELAEFYSAAEVTVLASSGEGMPNVLLESLACGTPVVATNFGGSAEIVADVAAGLLIQERSATAIAKAVKKLLDYPLERAATRAYAQRFSWHDPIAQQVDLLEQIVAAHKLKRTG